MKGLGRSNVVFIAWLFACTMIGCERSSHVTDSGSAGRVRGEKTGSIAGMVKAKPIEPQRRVLPEAVRKVCGDELVDKTLMVSARGALANAVVWVADAAPDEGKGESVLIDQRRCEYVPPVAVVHVGSRVRFRNS